MEVVLTTQERHQLVTVLRDLDKTSIKERRRDPRRKTLLNLWMHKICNGSKRRLAKIVLVNISVNGVGILSKMPCRPMDRLVLPLPFAEGGGWLVLCEVRNCQPLESGHNKIGCRFIDRIEDTNGDAKIPEDWR